MESSTEIVISGLAGHFPESHDVNHFRDNLYNKKDMVTLDSRRWDLNHPEIPNRTGKIHNISKFDAGFFGISAAQAHQMDPMVRLFLERALEALFDAGINPQELENTKTGVFIGVCFAETEKNWFFENVGSNQQAMTGCTRSMIAHRLSYFLKLKGPSYVCDTACSSSLYALEQAYQALKLGLCDRAIVGGTNICLHPFVSLQFARLGVLSMDGRCKSFDAHGDGYARSEAVGALILEPSTTCKRLYARVVHAKTNCDGFKSQGITYPSGPMQKRLLEDFYKECKVDPSTLSFLETHGTGTKVGDPEELATIAEIFCPNRSKPLMIGSVKSNIGHTEPSSGLCSITKAIIAFENGFIPPNMHYKSPREEVQALVDGQLRVVCQKSPFEDSNGLIGVNSFGFGGGNAHILLEWNKKIKNLPADGLPRLVTMSGRSLKAIESLFKAIIENKLKYEFIGLLHNIYKTKIPGHNFRGFIIVDEMGLVVKKAQFYQHQDVEVTVPNPNQFLKSSNKVQVLKELGEAYLNGSKLNLQKYYPKIDYPVSRGTPMISPAIRWEWSKDWFTVKYTHDKDLETGQKQVKINAANDSWKFLTGHVIDGRNLVPGTGYLQMIWEYMAQIKRAINTDMCIEFRNCQFFRATQVARGNHYLELTLMVQKGSGNFEIIESDQPVMKGCVRVLDKINDLELSEPYNNKELSLSQSDVYKELHLRGYHCQDEFKAIEGSNLEASHGLVKWTGNFATFMDCMLQMKIMETDTRLLYIPVGLKRITIDAKEHIKFANSFPDQKLPVLVYKDLNLIKCGGITIQGLKAQSIAQRKGLGKPVLESYEFVPNNTQLDLATSVRVNTQIVLENSTFIGIHVFKCVELLQTGEPLGPLVLKALEDQPLIQPQLILLTNKQSLDIPKEIQIQDKQLISETDCHLIVVSSCSKRKLLFPQFWQALKTQGFILSRETVDFDPKTVPKELTIITVHRNKQETMVLYKRTGLKEEPIHMVEIGSIEDLSWLDNVKTTLKTSKDVCLVSKNPLSGILGLTNCLKREPGTVFKCEQYFSNKVDQLVPKMAINIFKLGQWGTYRHLLLQEDIHSVSVEHCSAICTSRGDLSSLKWIEGPLKHDTMIKPEKTLVYVYYASLNFRDIMTASGRINIDVVSKDRRHQEAPLEGLEFAGRTADGRRVMGMVSQGSLTTLLEADSYFLWDIPENMTMEEAASIPTIYGTVLIAMKKAHLQKGQIVLIHSGSGGVGQAAINYCLFKGCKVLTTVGTKAKRDFLRQQYPQLQEEDIGNSRDCSFEQMVKQQTHGRGVDIILNSLAEDKLLASLRCLAPGGSFIEIGKFDLAQDNPLYLQLIEKGCSFHGMMMDQFITLSPTLRNELVLKMYKDLESGLIKPIPRKVFQMSKLEEAFRYMSKGIHMGKIVIQIRKEEPQLDIKPKIEFFKALPRYNCFENETYVIIGGLGGFGLELADWLVLRGAKKLVLTSRHGIKKGYQSMRIKIWKSYGCQIIVSKKQCNTLEETQTLVQDCLQLGPIAAIFNLAVILKDSMFEQQTVESFQESMGCKALASINLDVVSRKWCPMAHFICFSSVSCGRGNPGQTNYGYSNSIMERICEKRVEEGFKALAIQWGAIGDVGLVAEAQNEQQKEIYGTLQQKISSCLQTLDVFLKQEKHAVVSSMVVAEKRGLGGGSTMVDILAHILGIRDLKAISMHSTLAEVGMDSMTGVEIKQTLEREFNIFLTAPDIRNLTFAKVAELQKGKEAVDVNQDQGKPLMGMDMLLRTMGSEEQMKLSYVEMENKRKPKVVIFPGLEGAASILTPLANKLEGNLLILQYQYEYQPLTLQEMSLNLSKIILEKLEKQEKYLIVAYSFGVILALETIHILEKKGFQGRLVCIDGAPAQINEFKQIADLESEHLFETSFTLHFMSMYLPPDKVAKHRSDILKCNTIEDKIRKALDFAPKDMPHSSEYQLKAAIVIYLRIKAFLAYQPSYRTLQVETVLFKPTQNSMHQFAHDYKLGEALGTAVRVETYDGNHLTMLDNDLLAKDLNSWISQ